MTADEARGANIVHLLAQADRALAAARRELAAHDFGLVVNRSYYACFYTASAVLLSQGRHYVKHAGVRDAVHKYLVKPGRISKEFGDAYDSLMAARHEADYGAELTVTEQASSEAINRAEHFVQELRQLLPEGTST